MIPIHNKLLIIDNIFSTQYVLEFKNDPMLSTYLPIKHNSQFNTTFLITFLTDYVTVTYIYQYVKIELF